MNAPDNDIALLAALKTGNVEAFDHFYHLYRQWLLITAMTILQDEDEAQELVQEFFIDFWQHALYKRLELNTVSTLKNFLFVSIKNRCLNKISKDETRRKRMSWLEHSPHVPPDTRLEKIELHGQLEEAINLLPLKQSQVFRLAYQEHKTRKEIAAVLDISEETVKKHVAAALKTLRQLLEKIRF
ncbi:RNA polymerase sigma factor [Chitinophaga qingshengii]|uniref:Sigma-70 family RNA polymerase sigma factor n=1 Tax=Chitinophaga qingshengii TaxID=1569794 RepID=A0ABR7TEX7_9BACT|nr:sigma-70 family RNA polymerase sigma factor [Chitinophaga qingshengii]MBC9928847.1 sigma-70 family RNA polymerase sigma factor [Chitinophaga qingshengii]